MARLFFRRKKTVRSESEICYVPERNKNIMPIEIRELVIKATVGSGETGANSGNTEGSNSGGAGAPSDDFITVCVEKVLEILKEKAER